jgi:hypothetical protein
MHDDQDISDLSEARDKIDATREALRAALEAGGGDPIRQALARLDRIAAELGDVERVLAGQAVAVGESLAHGTNASSRTPR